MVITKGITFISWMWVLSLEYQLWWILLCWWFFVPEHTRNRHAHAQTDTGTCRRSQGDQVIEYARAPCPCDVWAEWRATPRASYWRRYKSAARLRGHELLLLSVLVEPDDTDVANLSQICPNKFDESNQLLPSAETQKLRILCKGTINLTDENSFSLVVCNG